ncbi:MAG: FliI/YscN family ATPase [Polyangiaceae bacterium]|jgi:flagellum-specific ATP synthase
MTVSESDRVDLTSRILRARSAPGPSPEGRVRDVVGVLVEIEGLTAPIGGQLELRNSNVRLGLEVVGFREGRLLAAPLGPTAGIVPDSRVRISPEANAVPVGDAMLGRVLDAFGAPLDDRPPPELVETTPLSAKPPSPFTRKPVVEPMATGVCAIDALLPLGKGQRIGLFAGTGVGKSTLLGMLCRHSDADVIVVGLVGERGREVGDFVRSALGEIGLARSVVIAATSDMPPLVRARGALRATAIAEHFRARGKSVLLLMDSVTRYAMALREASLAAGEPPLTKGYTPTVFSSLPALLERAGNDAGPGSITAVYTVLVEGDDLSDPIADAVRGILDGHIVLSRRLADRGLFPAIDVLRSVSRLATDITTSDQMDDATRARDALATYGEAADLIQIGAYVPGSDPRVDAARLTAPRVESLIRQKPDVRMNRQSAREALGTAVSGDRR